MRDELPYYHQLLRVEYSRLKSKNSSYSLRAFSKKLGIHPSTLSGVLLRRRRLAFRDALLVAKKLNLDEQNKKNLFESLLNEEKNFSRPSWPFRSESLFESANPLDERVSFKVIAEWEHYALFYLIQTVDFRSDLPWMASRLGVSEARIKEVIGNLVELNAISISPSGALRLAKNNLTTTDEQASRALRVSHHESLEKAQEAILDFPIHLRDFTSSVFAIDTKDIPKLKKEIRLFYERLCKYAKKKSIDEVYELCISLFPRSLPRETGEK